MLDEILGRAKGSDAFRVIAEHHAGSVEHARARVDDIYRINVRNKNGEMVPIKAFAEAMLPLAQAKLQIANRLAGKTPAAAAAANR